MAHLQIGGPAAGGGRRQRRGYLIPDVRRLMGITVSKVNSGNPNSDANQTAEEKLSLYFEFLLSRGVSNDEFQTVFESRRDQGEEINRLNVHAGGACEEWAGNRREYYYLSLLLKSPKHVKQEDVPQILGDMRSILKAIEGLKEEVLEIFESIKSRNGIPLRFPDVFDKEMVCPKVPHKVKRGARK